jgi:uncharacterized protein YcnI
MKHKLKGFLAVLLLTFAGLAGAASAHVVVKPSQVAPAEFQTFTLSVPNEKDVSTTSLRLVIPAGLGEVTPTVKAGWEINTKESGDSVTEISWSGGSIPAGFRDDFTFSAQAPDKPTDLQWKAYQTYNDGSVVSWDAAPSDSHEEEGDQGPYSVTKVSETVEDTATDTSSEKNQALLYIISIAALALALVALTKTTAKRK